MNQTKAAAGTTCGTDQVCDASGNCIACTKDMTCGTTCKPGKIACSTGAAVCAQTNAAPGTTCGATQVCDGSGSCVSCTASMACGTTCAPGQIACTTGAPVCQVTNAAPGTGCGSNMVCNGSGACVAKTADGGACTVSAQCQSGTCTGGQCACTAASCTTGCCSGNTCVPVASQTASMCGGGTNGACKVCSGMACVSGACTGSCSPGTSCNDMNDCTTSDTCNSSGMCTGTAKAANSVCTTSLHGLCLSGSCQCYQNIPAVACTSGPACMNWGFESGTAEGWVGDTSGGGSGITNVTISSSVAHTGSKSLAISLAIGAWSTNSAAGASVSIPLCAGTGTVNLSGYTYTAWVRFGTLTNGSFPMNAANLIQGGLAAPDMSGVQASNPIGVNSTFLNTWKQFGGTLFNPIANAASANIYVQFPLADPSSEGFSGTMYLDDIQILPP